MAVSPQPILHFQFALDRSPDGINQVACLESDSRDVHVRVGDVLCEIARIFKHGEVGGLSGLG